MNLNIIINLNEIGKKAFNANTKVININIKNPLDVTIEEINKVFPSELIDSFSIERSFKHVNNGDLLKVIDKDNKEYIVKVTSEYASHFKTIQVTDYFNKYICWYFHIDGIEQTHSKNKVKSCEECI